MNQIILTLLFTILVTSVSANPRKVVFFMPGLYGSEIVETLAGPVPAEQSPDLKDARVKWFNFKEAMTGSTSLALPYGLDYHDSLSKQVPRAPLKSVDVILGLGIDAYGKALKKLQKLFLDAGFEFVEVGYDWRREPQSGIGGLKQKIKEQNLQATDEKYLIGHSYGGLLSSYFLRYGDQIEADAVTSWEGLKEFKKVVLVTPAYRGAQVLLRNMNRGLQQGLNTSALSADAFSSFPSMFYLLPPKEFADMWVDKDRKEKIDLYDVNTFINNKWGLFNPDSKLDWSAEQRKKFVEHWAQRATQMRTKMELAAEPSTLPHKNVMILLGGDHDVWETGYKTQNNRVMFYFFEFWFKGLGFDSKKVFVKGDGSLADFATEPYQWMKDNDFQIIRTSDEHLPILYKQADRIFDYITK